MRRHSFAVALDHAAPAEVVGEILRRDASERRHPPLEAADVGIHVLNVEASSHALTLQRNQLHMRDAAFPGESDVARPTVGHEHCVARHQRIERLVERMRLEIVEDLIAGGFVPVAGY